MASANESLSASLSSLSMYSPTGSSQYHAWSRSYVELYTIVHEWTIDNFIELDDEAAVTFKVAVDAGNGNGSSDEHTLRFKLSLKPRYGEARDHVSLYVHNLNKKELKYSLVFHLLGSDRTKRLTRRADSRVHAPNESWGFPKFCQRAEVVDCPTVMLPNGALTVICEIGGFKRITSRSDYERVRERFDSTLVPDMKANMTRAFNEKAMDFTDVVIKVAGESFPCHRFMLCARSEVFRAMFSHSDLRESQEGVINLEGSPDSGLEAVTPTVVERFLRFIYTDTFEDDAESDSGLDFRSLSMLLSLAEKYDVRRLSALCGQRLLSAMEADNAAEIAVVGQMYGVNLLRHKAVEFISQHPEKVMATSGWQELLRQAPDVCTDVIRRLSRTSTASASASTSSLCADPGAGLVRTGRNVSGNN